MIVAAEYGSACGNSAQCHMERNECVEGRCQCRTGYTYHNMICKGMLHGLSEQRHLTFSKLQVLVHLSNMYY